jgi:putative hydrolase of the HAD superfamily
MTDLRACKIEWIFFDLGSTLIDETAVYARRVRETVSGSDVSAAEFEAAMRRFFAQGGNGYREACTFFHLQKTPWHSRDERLYDGCSAVLEMLKARGFRLGVIANQLPGTARRLNDLGILRYFDVVAASAELGMEKPDPAIFRWALREAGCEPRHAVMVGDRIDNDILPAQAIGMHTVRILSGPAAAYRPDDDPSDLTVASISDLSGLF